MDERFNRAVEIVLDHEKYWADHPQDSGKLTIWGISTKSFPDDVEKMKNMSKEESREYAKGIYHREFWLKGYDRIKSDVLAFKAFDLAVTTGYRSVNKALQRACNIIRNRWDNEIDGILGPKSLNLINAMPPRTMYTIFIGQMEDYYKSLNQPVFEAGWINRANEEVKIV